MRFEGTSSRRTAAVLGVAAITLRLYDDKTFSICCTLQLSNKSAHYGFHGCHCLIQLLRIFSAGLRHVGTSAA